MLNTTDRYVTLDEVLTEKVFKGRTRIESLVWGKWGAVRKIYCGDRDDLVQALTLALLTWHRDLCEPERLLESAVDKVLRKALVTECKALCRTEKLGEPVVGEDGDWRHWNPVQPEDCVSEERAKALASWYLGVSKLVGEAAAYVVKAHVVHGLTFYEIKKRLSNRCERGHYPTLEGYPDPGLRRRYSVEELEALYQTAVARMRENAESGKWVSFNNIVKYRYLKEPS